MDVMEALREHGDAGATIIDLLYGAGGEEISKSLAEQKKRERTQTRIAQASNIVGLAAGAAATPGAIAAVRPAVRRARGKEPLPPGRFATKVGSLRAVKALSKPKTAAGLAIGGAALQGVNLGGDAVTNVVLSRSAKKQGVSKGVDDIEWTGEFSKMDTDKRQVFGWASVTKVNGQLVKDLQDDEIDLEEIEKAAYDYVGKSRVGGNMHQKTETGPVHVSDLIESFVVTPDKKAQLGLPDDSPEGWWVGFQVNDDATWDAAKRGELVGFSIHGTGKRR